MAKRKPRVAPPVTLPPFPWDVKVNRPARPGLPALRARLARPGVERDVVLGDGHVDAEGEVELEVERVWRTALPPLFRNLVPACQMALLDYAAAVGAVGASGGTSGPMGGGGGAPGSRGPSLAKLEAAQRLGRMHAALAGGEALILWTDAGDAWTSRPHVARVDYRELARLVAVEAVSRAELFRRLGVRHAGEAAEGALARALVDMGCRLAVCCGHMAPQRPEPKRRNSSGGGV